MCALILYKMNYNYKFIWFFFKWNINKFLLEFVLPVFVIFIDSLIYWMGCESFKPVSIVTLTTARSVTELLADWQTLIKMTVQVKIGFFNRYIFFGCFSKRDILLYVYLEMFLCFINSLLKMIKHSTFESSWLTYNEIFFLLSWCKVLLSSLLFTPLLLIAITEGCQIFINQYVHVYRFIITFF